MAFIYHIFLKLGNAKDQSGILSSRIFSCTACVFPIVAWAYYEGIFTAFLTVNIVTIPKTFDEALVGSVNFCWLLVKIKEIR